MNTDVVSDVYDPEISTRRGFSSQKLNAFGQLTGRLLGQCSRFEYSAGFLYIRGGNSFPPHVPECVRFFLVTGPN